MMRMVMCLGALWLAGPAAAQLRVDITGGIEKPMPVAVPSFPTPAVVATPAGDTGALGRQLAGVISANLEGTGLFRPVSPSAYPLLDVAQSAAPPFAAFRATAAEALITGSITARRDGALMVSCRLHDVAAAEALVARDFLVTPAGWRRAAHKCSDLVYQRLTGEAAYFDSRIVYVAESGARTRRVKRLAIMDQDGANHRFLTTGQSLVLTPRFSPIDETITYMSYVGRRPRVYLYRIGTGQQEEVGRFGAMSFAPRFAPDGRSLLFSVSAGGNSDIWRYEVGSRRTVRLSQSPSINTSPSPSPDGAQIVFESDRGGSQQLYVMDADGGNVRRLTFGAGRAGSPVWSPRGDLIAFTRIEGGRFRIAVIRPDGTGERVLTNGWQDESPNWSPNGRVILFGRTERSGRSSLHAVDLTGRAERRIPTPVEASDPAWGPLLP